MSSHSGMIVWMLHVTFEKNKNKLMKKVLIIEDNEDVRDNTADLLELENYKVATADNGKVGIKTAKQFQPDVIICDIMMPELDGYGVLEALSKNNDTASIPFIFLTAKSEKADMRKGMNLGADDYLTKPFEEKELLEAIDSRLKKHYFLKKEFSKSAQGLNAFIEEASSYIGMEIFSKEFEPQTHKVKDSVFMEGAAAHNLYFIEKGTVKTFRTTESGKEFVTGFYSSGDFIGQLSLLTDHGTYLESATVMENAEIYSIPKLDFTTLLYSNKAVSNKFIGIISNNLVDLKEQLVDMAFAPVRQKVAKALLDLYSKGLVADNDTDGIDIPREDFAGLIGTATETAIRMLTEFKEEGLISIGYHRKIIILDKVALQRIADFAKIKSTVKTKV